MYIRQGISVGNLLLDLKNYRHGVQTSQKGARDAIIAEQGRKLVKLAEDILENGLNPFDLPMVVDANDNNQNFIVVEGNRRLTAIMLLLDPELASGTPIHKAFVRLNKAKNDSIPKVLDCVIAPHKAAARTWIDRKHANGLEGAGTEHWSATAKARADVDAGIARPDLDVLDFVQTDPTLDEKLRLHLEGGGFNLSTLQRLITTRELQAAAGFELKGGKLEASTDRAWLQKVLGDVVTTIYSGKHKGVKFTERSIDTPERREAFAAEIVESHPGRKKSSSAWTISGSAKQTSVKVKPAKIPTDKGTVSTEEQANLIPKKYRLDLPSGKINDIFIELKKLDVVAYRHSISVLFRVFIELTLDSYISKHSLSLPKDGRGNTIDKLSVRLSSVLDHVKETSLLTKKQLKPVEVAISDPNSLLATDTLNAYVHSPWMNPDPLQLKLGWVNIQPFIEALWKSESNPGQQ